LPGEGLPAKAGFFLASFSSDSIRSTRRSIAGVGLVCVNEIVSVVSATHGENRHNIGKPTPSRGTL
jgi:hypothetical protein